MNSKKQDNYQLDQLFASKLSELPEVEPAGEWSVLQKRLDAHYGKRRRTRLLLFFLAFLCLGTAIYQVASDSFFRPASVTVAQDPGIRLDGTFNSVAGTHNAGRLSAGDTSLFPREGVIVNKNSVSPALAKNRNLQRTIHKEATRIEQPNQVPNQEFTNLSTEKDSAEALVANDTALAGIEPRRSIDKKKTPQTVTQPEAQSVQESFLWVDVHAGVKRTSAMIKGKGQPGYFEKRNEEEQSAYYPSAGIDLRVQVKKVILSLGVELVNYGESIDYSSTAKKRFYFSSGGQAVYRDSTVTDPALVTQRRNKLTYIEFPLQAGYHFPSKGKTGFSLTGGMAVGFLAGTDNYYVDTALNGVVQYGNHDIRHFRQQSLSLLFHPSFEYRMKNLSEFYVSLQLRYQLSSVFNRKYEIGQQYFSPGFTIGYRFYRDR